MLEWQVMVTKFLWMRKKNSRAISTHNPCGGRNVYHPVYLTTLTLLMYMVSYRPFASDLHMRRDWMSHCTCHSIDWRTGRQHGGRVGMELRHVAQSVLSKQRPFDLFFGRLQHLWIKICDCEKQTKNTISQHCMNYLTQYKKDNNDI